MSEIRAISYEGDEERASIRLSLNNKGSHTSRESVQGILNDLSFLENPVDANTEDDITTPFLSDESKQGKVSPPVPNSNSSMANAQSGSGPSKQTNSWWTYLTTYTEDGIGLHIGLTIFVILCFLSASGVNINDDYATSSEWPFGAFVIGIVIIALAHWVLKKPQVFEPYCVIMGIAVISRAIGNYKFLAKAGLSASLWCVLIGVTVRSSGFVLTKGVFSGEFFVKIGVCLMNMDYVSVASIGAPGLVVAWLDTVLVLAAGVFIMHSMYKFDLKDSIVVSGATCICGSSAATALSSSVHVSNYEDTACKAIIAIMGVLNAPLMPLMPLAKTVFDANPAVVGAWIGGAIDSTGQVVASAEMGGEDVLKTAVIIKMAQNILIGPLCLFFTGYFQKSFEPKILVTRFPLFVVGFFITSAITTIILHNPNSDNSSQSDGMDMESLTNLIIDNSWCVAEWITLIGFACIGLEIDIFKFFSNNSSSQGKGGNSGAILSAYLVVQAIDLCTTFGWSYLVFHNYNWNNSEDQPVNPDSQ